MPEISISEKAIAALKRRTDAEEELLDRLKGKELELLNEFLDATVEYEDYIKQEN